MKLSGYTGLISEYEEQETKVSKKHYYYYQMASRNLISL